MEILGKIFGSPARVKMMRLFLLNKGKFFKSREIVKRSRVSSESARRELRLLQSIGFVRKRIDEWSFNYSFKYGREIEAILVNTDVLDNETVANIFKNVGKAKLIIISGVFIKNKDSRVDLLIVGNKLKKRRIEDGVRKIEAEMGIELVYAVFDTKEFIYRVNMYDKLVRDILDFPHEVVLQAKELSTQALKKP
jgi:hypothetical protein